VALDSRGEGACAVLVGGAEQQIAVAPHALKSLRAQHVAELNGALAARALDADLPIGIALLGGLGALLLDPLAVLGGPLLGGVRLRRVGILPALGTGMPVAQLELDVPLVALGQRAHELARRLRLLARTGVAEHLGAVDRDDDPIAEGPLERVLDLSGVDSLGERPRDPVLVNRDPNSPIVL
jgi:hypothetical protein